MSQEFIAHAKCGQDGAWAPPHLLADHVHGVAALAEQFAAVFGNGDWGRLAGLWHDLGKYQPDFQDYIRKRSGFEEDKANEGGPGRVDHSIVGALWAMRRYGDEGENLGRALAYLIAGHHAGLPDWSHVIGTGGALSERLDDDRNLRAALEASPPEELLDATLAESSPGGRRPEAQGDGLLANNLHLWIRMLFSCLVDADFLDTEGYMTPTNAGQRKRERIDLTEAKRRLDASLAELAKNAPDTAVNRVRQEILTECRGAAILAPGLFSLTVPTGGGKTLAGMSFALEHALAHGKRRIIVAIPYTSIIEQSAEVYRSVFGPEAVIEHHSSLDPDRETTASRLATENWDAPIIVTTNVQLFESLFASRGSACRKLHNLADSVIILDEAQIFPVGYLQPAVEALKGLVEFFGATIVLSTATQPALSGTIKSGQAKLDGFAEGSVREIISDPAGLAHQLRRVEIVRHPKGEEPVSWEEIAEDMKKEEQVLCIVSSRRDCRELHALLPEGSIHLSALMCPEHRSEVITRIKDDLKNGRPIRVVSTQLVEAGVDLDFPVVYRALAGLDSIAQAAGRCNREGRLSKNGKLGKVVVFTPPRDAPPGILRKGQDAGREMFRLHPEESVSLTPEAFTEYFRLFYGRVNSFDEKSIMGLLAGPDVYETKIQFRTAASSFALIDDGGQHSIIVWFDGERSKSDSSLSSQSLVAKIENFGPDRATLRRLQRYSVNVPLRVFEALRDEGAIRAIKGMDGLYIQSLPGLYDDVFGLRLEGPVLSPQDFMA